MKQATDLVRNAKPHTFYTYICAVCETMVEVKQKEDILPPGWIETAEYDTICLECQENKE